VNPDYDILRDQLVRWDGRRRWAEILKWLPRGLLAGLLIAAMVAAIARIYPVLLNQEVAVFAGALAMIGALISILLVLLKRRSLIIKARYADRKYGLLERTSTAIEIKTGRSQTTPMLAEKQLADAVYTMKMVNTERLLPLRLNWRDLVMLSLTSVLLLLALLLPNPLSKIVVGQRQVNAAIEEQVTTLRAIKEDVQSDTAIAEEQRPQLLAPIEAALEQLQDSNINRELAVAVLSEGAADLREISETYDTSALRDTLGETGKSLSENPISQSAGQALQRGDLAAAGSALNSMADQLPTHSLEELSGLGSDLEEIANGLKEVDPDLARKLEQAAAALQQGDVSSAQQALREVAATLQQRALEQAAARRATVAADEITEGSQQVAQAGQPGQQADGLGQNQGQTDQGAGSESSDGQAQGQGQGAESEHGNNPGGPGPGGGHAENVFVPGPAFLDGEQGVDVELPAECVTDPESCGYLLSERPTAIGEEQSLVPYDQVFSEYRDVAYQTLESQYVPLGLRHTVRDYFSSLEP